MGTDHAEVGQPPLPLRPGPGCIAQHPPSQQRAMSQIAGRAERRVVLSVSREGGRRVALSVGSCLTLHLKTLTLG